MPRPTPCSTTAARSRTLRGSTVYVTLFPCHDCAKILAQVGVGEVVYLDNKYADTDDGRISRRILDSCGISYRQVIVNVQIGTGDKLSSDMRCRHLTTNAVQRAPSQIDYS